MSVEEVQQKLSYLPKDFVDRSIANTNGIFDKCNVTIEFGQHLYPKFAKYGKAKEMFLDELRNGYKDKILGKVNGNDKKLVDERILHEIDILEKVLSYYHQILDTVKTSGRLKMVQFELVLLTSRVSALLKNRTKMNIQSNTSIKSTMLYNLNHL